MCSKKGYMSRLRILELTLGFKRGLKKGTYQLFLWWNPTLLCHPLQHLNMFWLQCFSILIFSKNLNPSHCSPSFLLQLLLSLYTTIRDGKSKHEKKLMIANGEGEFNQDVLVLGNQFKIEYDQLVEAKNYGQILYINCLFYASVCRGPKMSQAWNVPAPSAGRGGRETHDLWILRLPAQTVCMW